MEFKPVKRENVTSSYVRPADYEAITNYCKGTAEGGPSVQRAIGFREAGGDTLARLNDGAAAKGHDILEKSIKKKSMGANIGNIPENVKGLVGCWKKEASADAAELMGAVKELNGIYITSCFREYMRDESGQSMVPGKKRLESVLSDVKTEKVTHITFDSVAGENAITVETFIKCLSEDPKTVNMAEVKSNLQRLQKLGEFISEYNARAAENKMEGIPNAYHCFYTGDYDLHEIITYPKEGFQRGRRYEKVDFAVVEGLNDAIKRNPDYLRKDTMEFNVVRHGPQCAYLYYSMNHAGQNISIGLLRADFPVAICDAGEWYILKNEDELEKFYTEKFKLEADGLWVLAENKPKEELSSLYSDRLKSWIVFRKMRVASELKAREPGYTLEKLAGEYGKIKELIETELSGI